MRTFIRSLVAFSTASSILVGSTAAFALEGSFSAEGTKQKFAADRFSGIKYDVKSPRDLATGMASGKRQHTPICVYKPSSATTPQYFQAVITNEVLKSATFDVANGMRIKLTNATASSFALVGGPDGKDLEELCFTFQKIEVSFKGGAVSMDDWMAHP